MNISSILLETFFEEILRRSPREKGIVEVTGLIIEKNHCSITAEKQNGIITFAAFL